jgi:hypothetical protein
VYHVFGVFGVPESLVLTEDDFLDFLIATSTYKLMPAVVRGSLTDSALIFLGFRLDDWTFRVLFRMIMNLEGSAGMRKYSHVGVQVDPGRAQPRRRRAGAALPRALLRQRPRGRPEPSRRSRCSGGARRTSSPSSHRRLEATRVEETPAASRRSLAGDWF